MRVTTGRYNPLLQIDLGCVMCPRCATQNWARVAWHARSDVKFAIRRSSYRRRPASDAVSAQAIRVPIEVVDSFCFAPCSTAPPSSRPRSPAGKPAPVATQVKLSTITTLTGFDSSFQPLGSEINNKSSVHARWPANLEDFALDAGIRAACRRQVSLFKATSIPLGFSTSPWRRGIS
jgi:hypothetical protein